MATPGRSAEPDPGDAPADETMFARLRRLATMPEINAAGRRKVEAAIAKGMTINEAIEMSRKISTFILDKRNGRI